MAQGTLLMTAVELTNVSIRKCETKGSYRHISIHDIRKNLKKIRALLKLVKSQMELDNYKLTNKFYRDIGRDISDIRDASSRLEIVEKLQLEIDSEKGTRLLETIELQLKSYKRKLSRETFTANKTLINIKNRLKNGLGKIKACDKKDYLIKDIIEAIQLSYLLSNKARLNAQNYPEAENFHDWRKLHKTFMYQLKFMEEIYAIKLDFYEIEIDLLSNYLGDYNDLAILTEAIENGIVNLNKTDTIEVFSIINEKSKFLKAKALKLGEYIYSHKPVILRNRFDDILKLD